MTVKFTMFMQAENYSWSETHYALAVTTFQQALAQAYELAIARVGILGQFASLAAARLSAVPANRQVYELNSNAWPGPGSYVPFGVNGGEQADAPFSTLLMNIQNVDANKNLYLSGAPDGVIQFSPNTPNGFDPSGSFPSKLIQYMGKLCGSALNGSWGFRSRVSGFPTQVAAVGDEGGFGNNIGVSTQFSPGIAVGQEAYLKGFRTINPRLPNLSGAYTVLAVIPPGSGNPNFITVLNETGNVSPDNFLTLGTIEALNFQYLQYQNWRLVRVTHRKRGGSYGQPRGKSRVRR